MNNHYNKSYYQWQKKSASLGAMIDLWHFQPYIKITDSVLDFGCGDGSILEKLQCKRRFGVEINKSAIQQAKKRGIGIFTSISDIASTQKFDVIISHHSLEHVHNPFEVLQDLKKHTKKGGYNVHVVPIDDWRMEKQYDPHDINQHLYTWTPRLLGNVFSKAGFRIVNVEILTHAWLPLSAYTYRILPAPIYHILCKIWSVLTNNRQLRIVTTV